MHTDSNNDIRLESGEGSVPISNRIDRYLMLLYSLCLLGTSISAAMLLIYMIYAYPY